MFSWNYQILLIGKRVTEDEYHNKVIYCMVDKHESQSGSLGTSCQSITEVVAYCMEDSSKKI